MSRNYVVETCSGKVWLTHWL